MADSSRRPGLHDVALRRVGAHGAGRAAAPHGRYARHAKAIGRALRAVEGVEVLPDPPQSAMLHVRLATTETGLRAAALRVARAEKVWTFARPFVSEGPTLQRCELAVGDATLELSAPEVAELVGRLVG